MQPTNTVPFSSEELETLSAAAWLSDGRTNNFWCCLLRAPRKLWRDALVYLSTRRNGPARAQRHPKGERTVSSFVFLKENLFFFSLSLFFSWLIRVWPDALFASHQARQRLHFLPFHERNGREGKRYKEEKIWIITRRFNNHYRAKLFFSQADPTSRRALTCGENKLN